MPLSTRPQPPSLTVRLPASHRSRISLEPRFLTDLRRRNRSLRLASRQTGRKQQWPRHRGYFFCVTFSWLLPHVVRFIGWFRHPMIICIRGAEALFAARVSKARFDAALRPVHLGPQSVLLYDGRRCFLLPSSRNSCPSRFWWCTSASATVVRSGSYVLLL